MKDKYRLFRRNNGIYFIEDRETKKQESLRTKDEVEANRLFHARNESFREPVINRQIAKAYLTAGDPSIGKRTWKDVFEEIINSKQGETQNRWRNAAKDQAFDLIRHLPLFETRSDHFLKVLRNGTVSTNVYLRRAHNFAVDMQWLMLPVLPRKHWPKVSYQDKRGITLEEHQRIIEREPNSEWKAFYQLAWYLGASQSDLANLTTSDIDRKSRVISFGRRKVRFRNQRPVLISYGVEVEAILQTLPQDGLLFPRVAPMHEKHRAKLFNRRCKGLGIMGVSLHSYRYAWAERAKAAGMPERFAMEALGQSSKAVHRVYAKKALVKVPALEEWEKKIVPFNESKPIEVTIMECKIKQAQ